jgi:hypothetical protein
MSFIINLFGDCVRYWECTISEEQFIEFEKIKNKSQLTWETILINFEFLNHFGYSHWSEFSKQKEKRLFALTPLNKIEIKEKNKFILKIGSDKILNNNSLFELYNTIISPLKNTLQTNGKSFLITQKETGLYGKYEVNSTIFDINKLEFKVFSKDSVFNIETLTSVSYDNKSLTIKKEDTMVRNFQVDWLN